MGGKRARGIYASANIKPIAYYGNFLKLRVAERREQCEQKTANYWIVNRGQARRGVVTNAREKSTLIDAREYIRREKNVAASQRSADNPRNRSRIYPDGGRRERPTIRRHAGFIVAAIERRC